MLSSAIALLLGLLLFIVFWLDHPFENPRALLTHRFSNPWGLSTQSTAEHDQASEALPIAPSLTRHWPGRSAEVRLVLTVERLAAGAVSVGSRHHSR